MKYGMRCCLFLGPVFLVFGLSCTSAKNDSLCKTDEKINYVKDVGSNKEEILTAGEALPDALDRIAETERSRGYVPGLALAESVLRERAGDYAGAVIAAYKETAWIYAMSDMRDKKAPGKAQIKEGLERVVAIYTGSNREIDTNETLAIKTAEGVLCFIDENWNEASLKLEEIFGEDEETDSFPAWMILVSRMASGDASRKLRLRYAALRSRYERFPAYWYWAARFASEGDLSRINAERCINISSWGPYAIQCRELIFSGLGISGDAQCLRTRVEIEGRIRNAVSSHSPEQLDDILPVLSLPDNPYTMYAMDIIRRLGAANGGAATSGATTSDATVGADSKFKEYFSRKAVQAKGRLGERLQYIERGLL